MPLLAPGGDLPSIGEIAKGALSRRLPVEEIAIEIEAQLDAFEQATDRRPDFIDGHQHVHGLAGVRRALLAVLRERYARGPKPWLRDPRTACPDRQATAQHAEGAGRREPRQRLRGRDA